MFLKFSCPNCERADRVDLVESRVWTCPNCAHVMPLTKPEAVGEKPVPNCVACGNAEMYRQKNFPQWLGMSLLALACGAFFVLQILYQPWLAWAILIGSAAVDGLLYAFVGDAVICYRCEAKHTGLPKCRGYDPFELAIAEKYRQERLRRELKMSNDK